MCYEKEFFDHWAAKRAQRQKEQMKTSERSPQTKAEPVRPTAGTKQPKEVERETELV